MPVKPTLPRDFFFVKVTAALGFTGKALNLIKDKGMSKNSIFLFLFLLMPVLGIGQILIGINGGFNMSVPLANSNTNPYHDASLSINQNSYLVSVFVKRRIPHKVVNLGYAAEYCKTGLTGHQSKGGLGGGTNYNYNFTLHFLNLMVKPEFVFGSKWKFIINSGAYFGILLHVHTTGNWTTYGPNPVTSGVIIENTNNYFQYLNFGFLGGIGTEYPVTDRIIINLEADYMFGITNIAKGSLSSEFFNLLNGQLTVGVAYKFNWIKRNDKEKKKIDWYEG
ncbi:MAG: PorT family protein [Bacteroidales bacterium]|jgi:hypothetical protein|nr:PorT family protein [Bacteroidales bacterium]